MYVCVRARDFGRLDPKDVGRDNVYNIIVTASDGVNSTSKEVAITVTNANDAPSITSEASASTQETNGTVVYTARATDQDPNTTLTYSLSGGADYRLFNIDRNTGEVTFKTPPNFEAPGDSDKNNIYEIIVQVSDGSLTDTKTV